MIKKYVQKNKLITGIAVVVVLLVLGTLTAYVAGYINTKEQKAAENRFTPAVIRIAVQESGGTVSDGDINQASVLVNEFLWKHDDTKDIWSAEKKVRILNVNNEKENNAPAYIRVCIVPKWVCRLETEDADTGSVYIDVITHEGLSDFGALTDIDLAADAENNTFYDRFTMGDISFILNKEWSDSWIFNPEDGYFYYRNPVQPGETTEFLLDSVSVTAAVREAMESVGVELQVDILADSIQTEADALKTRWGSPENLGIEIGGDGVLKKYADGGVAGE